MIARSIVLMIALVLAAPACAAERILALAPHICEIVHAVGAGEEMVGAVDYCDYPPAVKRLPRVGNYLGVNAEAALRLKPTLVIAFNGADPGLKPLRAHGARILVSRPRNIAEVIEDIRQIGRAAYHSSEAEHLAGRMEARLAELESRVSHRRVRAFYEIWPSPLISPARDSFITDLLQRAGFASIFADHPGETVRASLEGVIRAAPEVVFVPDEKRSIEERRAYWRRWLGEDVRVIALPHDIMHRPGPRLLEGLDRLVTIRLGLEHE